MIPDLVGVCDACAEGNHNGCMALWVAVMDGAYPIAPDVSRCGCSICWGRAR